MALIADKLVGFLANIIVFGSLPFIWWLIFYRKRDKLPDFLGLTKPKLEKSVPILIGFLVIYCLYYNYQDIIYDILATSADEALLKGSDSVQANEYAGLGMVAILPAFIGNVFGNGFCEELFYRGFLLKRFSNRMGSTLGMTVSAALFGFMHNGLFLLAGMDFSFGMHVAAFLVTFIASFLLGYANEKVFNGSIWPSIILHGLGNFYGSIINAF